MLVSNSLVALFKSSFGFYVVDLHSRPSSIIVFLAKRLPSMLTIRSWLIYLIVAYLLPTTFHFLQQDSISLFRFLSTTMVNSRDDIACYLLALSQELFISKLVLILILRQPSWQYVVSFLCVEIHNKSTLTMRQLSSKLVKN